MASAADPVNPSWLPDISCSVPAVRGGNVLGVGVRFCNAAGGDAGGASRGVPKFFCNKTGEIRSPVAAAFRGLALGVVRLGVLEDSWEEEGVSAAVRRVVLGEFGGAVSRGSSKCFGDESEEIRSAVAAAFRGLTLDVVPSATLENSWEERASAFCREMALEKPMTVEGFEGFGLRMFATAFSLASSSRICCCITGFETDCLRCGIEERTIGFFCVRANGSGPPETDTWVDCPCLPKLLGPTWSKAAAPPPGIGEDGRLNHRDSERKGSSGVVIGGDVVECLMAAAFSWKGAMLVVFRRSGAGFTDSGSRRLDRPAMDKEASLIVFAMPTMTLIAGILLRLLTNRPVTLGRNQVSAPNARIWATSTPAYTK